MKLNSVHLRSIFFIYAGAVDLRICLILNKLDISFLCFSSLNSLLRRFPDGCDGIVLIDVGADHIGGIARTEHLIAHLSDPRVIPICTSGTIDFVRKCFKAGAMDVIDKSLDEESIADTLMTSLECSHAPCHLNSGQRQRFELLTERERLVFEYIANGFTNREIAHTLCLSPRTIECYRAHLNEKLGVKNVAHMVFQYSGYIRKSRSNHS